MAGPKEHTKAERVTWHFEIRHGREEEMQSEHLVARYTGPWALPGRKLFSHGLRAAAGR